MWKHSRALALSRSPINSSSIYFLYLLCPLPPPPSAFWFLKSFNQWQNYVMLFGAAVTWRLDWARTSKWLSHMAVNWCWMAAGIMAGTVHQNTSMLFHCLSWDGSWMPKRGIPRGKEEKLQVHQGPRSEISEHHFCQDLLVRAVIGPAGLKGK